MTAQPPTPAPEAAADVRKAAEAHLDAWRAGDAGAVAAAVATYEDPDSGGALAGAALAEHVTRTTARFRNARFAVDRVTGDADAATVSWTLLADHRESYLGMPATGGAVTVSGADLVTRDERGVHVRRLFDRLALAEALGYTARFVPGADEAREFGVSARAATGRTDKPGALVLTWLEIRDDAEAADVDLLSVEIVKSLRSSKGFLGVTTFDIGARKFTLSAFDRPESLRAVHARPHQRAMRRFFKGGLCTRVHTSVWYPATIRDYARCPACGTVVAAGKDAACACGWAPEDASTL
ncbi:ester cyclase [Nonomuraea sp. 3-1Str]|uniref:ester cyclase n=1 Tax=Nonomuraea sp. 3-1Str TaxID=2929801 RepID=UPI00286677DE|nr:ester cyclase [Nonomuraea sp. 3-1Str]MDR8412914.1 ester cyclase [Nonomuraea sp. 3-1Str]